MLIYVFLCFDKLKQYFLTLILQFDIKGLLLWRLLNGDWDLMDLESYDVSRN